VKERLVTFALALAALLLFYALVFPKPQPASQQPSRPVSTDSGPDGQLALWQWLQAENIPVSSLRYRYDRLGATDITATATGNVLISVMPHQLQIRNDEWAPVNRWIESGNTLLVIAALDDTPRWSMFATEGFLPELRRFTGIAFEALPEKKTEPSQESQDPQALEKRLKTMMGTFNIDAVPRGQHPLLSQVHRVHGVSDLPASRWRANPVIPAMPLSLLERSDGGATVLWLMQRGRGQIIVCSMASPFSNSQIDQNDNARLLSNILAWSRGENGRVIFDDAHQGLTAFYDAHAFFADPRLHRTLWWLVLLWLVFVLGPLPLRSAFTRWKPVDETVLIDASGRFYSVAVAPLDAAQRLFENFFNELRRKLNLPENGEPLWDWLKTRSRVTHDERSLLQRLFADVRAGERIDLRTLHNLLSDLQGKVA
jgi:hypothetical protein